MRGQTTVYVAGPMRGYPEFNFPAFREAARFLRTAGYAVFSPAEMDEAHGFQPKTAKPSVVQQDIDTFIDRDIKAIRKLDPGRGDFLYLLKGWQHSKGATAEAAYARWRGLTLVEENTGVVDFIVCRGLKEVQ